MPETKKITIRRPDGTSDTFNVPLGMDDAQVAEHIQKFYTAQQGARVMGSYLLPLA